MKGKSILTTFEKCYPLGMLAVQITRISPTHHLFECKREDGSGESAELETKTFLQHDFIHFCVESEATLTKGFFGLLESGSTFASLTPERSTVETAVAKGDVSPSMEIEQVVGIMTGVIKGAATPQQTIEGAKNLFGAYGKPIPAWLTEDFIERVVKRYRQVNGEFNSLKFGETLVLNFR